MSRSTYFVRGAVPLGAYDLGLFFFSLSPVLVCTLFLRAFFHVAVALRSRFKYPLALLFGWRTGRFVGVLPQLYDLSTSTSTSIEYDLFVYLLWSDICGFITCCRYYPPLTKKC